MAIRAAGTGGRAWSEMLLGRPWPLVVAVALFVALPVLVLGQTSENDTRARLAAAQAESAAHAADVATTSFRDRENLVQATLAALALKPTPELSPIGLAAKREDIATLQALVDAVQSIYPRGVLRAYIAVREAGNRTGDANVVAASTPALVGQRLPADLLSNCRRGCGLDLFVTGFVGDDFPGAVDAPAWEPILAVIPGPGRTGEEKLNTAPAEIVAELDLGRTFADAAVPALAATDDAYLLDSRRRLIGRARGPTPFPLRDLSADPVVQRLRGEPIVSPDVADPLGSGSRLIAGTRLSGSDWWVLLLRDTTAIDREIDAVLGQLAAGRYVLVALLLVGAVLVAQAAGAQIRQRQALATANERIEAASLHKSAFLSNMSHELRTPLNSINGFSDVLLSGIGGELTEKQREYLTDIRGSGDHLLALVNDVLDLSRVEAGRMELHPTEFDLRETVEAVHRVVAPLAEQKRQQLRLEPGDGGTVQADQARLRQVLLNVLSNAVKYTPDGGTVNTSIARRDDAIDIAVRDSGVGIAPADQARVFEDFTRVDTGYAQTQQGTGLGLALARRLARLMGGDVTLASEVGRGSTFTVTIPAVDG